MRERFTVDLRGLVEILSHHLYRNERVYLRELVQNAHDAIRAREALGPRRRGSIEIVPARGYEQLIVRDNGIGLTADDMRSLLSIIGSTSKRADVAAVRRPVPRPVRHRPAVLLPGRRHDRGHLPVRAAHPTRPRCAGWARATAPSPSDRPCTRSPSRAPRSACGPGTGCHRWCDTDACTQFASEFAELLDVPVHIGEATLSQQPRPWTLSTEEQLTWCRERFGFEAMGIIPFDTRSAASSASRSCCPTPRVPATAPATASTRRECWSPTPTTSSFRDGRSSAAPSWTWAICRSPRRAKAFRSPGELQFVRKQIGFRLLTELIIVQGQHPDVYADIVRLHADGLKALAVPGARRARPPALDAAVRDHARRPHHPAARRPPARSPTSATPTPTHALADVAAHAGVLVVNASGLHEAELLRRGDEHGHFREVAAAEVVELARPVPHPDVDAAAALSAKARAALADGGPRRRGRRASSPPTGQSCGGPPAPATAAWC